FALQHQGGLAFGGWLQAMGSLLLVLYAVALVHLADATRTFFGWFTLLAGAVVLMVSLLEGTVYIAGLQAAGTGDVCSGLVSDALIKAVQHVFLIAPALLLPLGAVLWRADLLPRVFAYAALLIGTTLQLLGVAGLFRALQSVIDACLIVQALWFVATGALL